MAIGAALLIGNRRYQRGSLFPPLSTPYNDVENLGEALRGALFETFVVHDADRAVMASVFAQFADRVSALPPQSSVFVYYAGHGIQRAGENYLVPVDAVGGTEAEVLLSCMRLSEILDLLCSREDQQKLIALDACRTNHVPSSTRCSVSGLAGVSPERYENVHETFVHYSTAPGRVALDGAAYGSSPFARGLLEHITSPGLPIAALAARVNAFVYRATEKLQRPWGTGNLCEEWSFIPALTKRDLSKIAPEDRYIAERPWLVHKLSAKDSNQKQAYYFVFVEAENEARFLDAIKGDRNLDLSDHGVVIASNFGNAPDEKTLRILKERYGFDITPAISH